MLHEPVHVPRHSHAPRHSCMHHVSRGGRGVGESHWRFYTSLSRLSHNHPSLVFHLIVWTCLATCAGLSAEFDFKSGGSCEKGMPTPWTLSPGFAPANTLVYAPPQTPLTAEARSLLTGCKGPKSRKPPRPLRATPVMTSTWPMAPNCPSLASFLRHRNKIARSAQQWSNSR